MFQKVFELRVGRALLRARPPWALCFVALLASAPCVGCGTRQVEDVTIAPSLAMTPRAQQELRAIEGDWEASSVSARSKLAPRLESFIRRHPQDPGTDRARVLLAWIRLERGELKGAQSALGPALRAPESTTRDHARLIHAALLTREGEPAAALDILEALRGKLVGREVTQLHGRERVRAALEARRWRLLVTALTEWLEDSGEAQNWTRQSARRSLARVPAHTLLRLLEERTRRERNASERWIGRAITEQLTQTALDKRDARLARQLLEVAPSWLRAGPDGEKLALLAREGAREARVEGRTLGIVVEVQDPVLRRRSSQMIAGVIDALGMGQATEDADVRLVVRENQSNMAATLASLTSEGASVLVAGVGDLGALVALAFAEERRVPVLVLRDPLDRPRELEYGFVLGTQEDEERLLLEAELGARGIERLQQIGQGGHSCGARPALGGAARFPIASWQADGYRGALIFGDAACARQALGSARGLKNEFSFGFALEASTALFDDIEGSSVGLGAGHFPGAAGVPSAPWYELLGRDAARLAGSALAVVPEDTAVDGEAVRLHLEKARNALRTARAPLETSEAPGFSGKHVLSRELRVIKASGPKTNTRGP